MRLVVASWFIALILCTACSSASTGAHPPKATTATSSRSETTANPPVRAPGPLTAPSAGNFYYTYSNVNVGERVTIAAVGVVNSGAATASLEEISAVGSSGVKVVGTYVADPRLVSPGTYRGFPPPAAVGGAATVYSPHDYKIAVHAGALVLVVLGLANRMQAGTILGVSVRYRSAGREFEARFREVTLLCSGDSNTLKSCSAALSVARAKGIGSA